MLKQSFMILLASMALSTACNINATGNNASSTSTSATASALSTNSNTTALAVGQWVSVIFDVTDPNTVAEVAIADPNDHGPGGRTGPGDGVPPAGNSNCPTPPDPNTAGLRGNLHGSVAAVDLSTGKLTVLGVEVLTDVNTSYVGVANLAAIQVGMLVDIEGQSAANGSFTALRVGVRPADLSGVMTAVSSDSPPVITVLGRRLSLSATTQVVQMIGPSSVGGHHGPGDPQGGGRPPRQ